MPVDQTSIPYDTNDPPPETFITLNPYSTRCHLFGTLFQQTQLSFIEIDISSHSKHGEKRRSTDATTKGMDTEIVGKISLSNQQSVVFPIKLQCLQ